MMIIFNRASYSLTKENMLNLYKKGLIVCDDLELRVARIPEFAISFIEKLYNIEFNKNDIYRDLSINLRNNQQVQDYNKKSYPYMFKTIMKV